MSLGLFPFGGFYNYDEYDLSNIYLSKEILYRLSKIRSELTFDSSLNSEIVLESKLSGYIEITTYIG